MPGRDIRLVMEGKPRNLIETVATDIATNILQDYRRVKGLKISVQKPHVALDGVVKSMGAASPDNCKGCAEAQKCLPAACVASVHCPEGCLAELPHIAWLWCETTLSRTSHAVPLIAMGR